MLSPSPTYSKVQLSVQTVYQYFFSPSIINKNETENYVLSKCDNTNQLNYLFFMIWHQPNDSLQITLRTEYLRHRDDHEIQPVPWISKECEVIYTESTGNDFYSWFKRINSSEGIPEGKSRSNWIKKMDLLYTFNVYIYVFVM